MLIWTDKATPESTNVDNTSDLNKPVSTATQTALDGKASGVALTNHMASTISVHNFDSSGNAPAQSHDNTKHSATYIIQANAVAPNAAITSATKTKITYDTKGLVTAGADATTADIADSTDKRYCTDAQKTVIGNTSGTNTGDQTAIPNSTLATMTTKSYKGRTSASTGTPEDVDVATLKTDLGIATDISTHAALTTTVHGVGTGTIAKVADITATQVGLGNCDNTSDLNKPVSTATQTALNLKGNITSQTFVTPVIGVATGTSLAVTGALTSSGGGVGYATGAGGTITQLTSRTTGVTLNKLCGTITMYSAAQASQALVTFTLTNSFIASTDYLAIRHISATNGGAWNISPVCGSGSATISIRNVTSASITEATPLKFVIIKAVTA